MSVGVTEIPVVDLGADDPGAGLIDAYSTVGFSYLVGHGIDPALVEEVFEQSRRFHALPADRKAALCLDRNHRGYIARATSTDVASELGPADQPNQSESFMTMRDAGPDDPDVAAGVYLAGANQWPDLDGFRATVESYERSMAALGHRVVALFAAELAAPPSFMAAFDRPTTWLRLIRYPALDAPPHEAFGSAPHVDFGAVTILAQDDVGGLQVAAPDGRWLDVPPMPGAFIMNTGEMLHRWSNGRILATPHRVAVARIRERFSVPFFYDPHMSTVVEPMPSCRGTDDRRPRFEPITFEAYVRHQLEASYDQHRG